MQGYHKTKEEREFAIKVEEFFKSKKIFYAKNYAEAITEYSKPDYFICLCGRFVGVEISNYSQPLNCGKYAGKLPIFDYKNALYLKRSKGGFLKVKPEKFEEFKAYIEYALTVFKKSKSFEKKIQDSLNPKKRQFKKRPDYNDSDSSYERQPRYNTNRPPQFTVETVKRRSPSPSRSISGSSFDESQYQSINKGKLTLKKTY